MDERVQPAPADISASLNTIPSTSPDLETLSADQTHRTPLPPCPAGIHANQAAETSPVVQIISRQLTSDHPPGDPPVTPAPEIASDILMSGTPNAVCHEPAKLAFSAMDSVEHGSYSLKEQATDEATELDPLSLRSPIVQTPNFSMPCESSAQAAHDDGSITAPPKAPTQAPAPQQKLFDACDKVTAVASFDGKPHPAEVIECTTTEGGETSYYIHFCELNKRLDEWLPADQVEARTGAATPCLPTPSPRPLMGATPTPLLANSSDLLSCGPGDRKLTRNLKRRYDEMHNVETPVEDLTPIDQTLEKEHEEKTRVKNIQVVEMGRWEVDTWYFSPFPGEYAHQHKLYVCEFCLKYMKKQKTYLRHKASCTRRCPPGKEIYRDNGREYTDSTGTTTTTTPLSAFEVDGREHKVYCQNLCLLAKLFLDHKTLYFDVELFLFYLVVERDAQGFSHVVGYFSKEKLCAEEYCLACILTLPPYQRKGYGRFLISLAYELSKKEGKIGTPERPLSDLGQVSFRSYWTRVLLDILKEFRGNVSIKNISALTSIRYDDIVSTLQSLSLIKYWKGQYIISVTPKIVEEHLKTVSSHVQQGELIPENLVWSPPTDTL